MTKINGSYLKIGFPEVPTFLFCFQRPSCQRRVDNSAVPTNKNWSRVLSGSRNFADTWGWNIAEPLRDGILPTCGWNFADFGMELYFWRSCNLAEFVKGIFPALVSATLQLQVSPKL